MRLFLFLDARGDIFPVIELTLADPVEPSEGRGWWARIKGDILRFYQNLVERLDYHERLCSQLRFASHLKIYHPAAMSSDQALQHVHRFCRHRSRKHALWMWLNGILAAFGTLLVPVPGPNIFFFYPAARCLGHYAARKGSRKVLSDLPVEYGSEPLLEEVQSRLPNLEGAQDAMAEFAERYNLGDLEKILGPLSEDRERK